MNGMDNCQKRLLKHLISSESDSVIIENVGCQHLTSKQFLGEKFTNHKFSHLNCLEIRIKKR